MNGVQEERQTRPDEGTAHIRDVWGPVHISIDDRTQEAWRKLPNTEPIQQDQVEDQDEDVASS